MAGYTLLKRLEILIEILRRKPEITKAEIMDKLAISYNIDTSARTLERDFEKLASEFRIDVIYTKTSNGYSIDTENHERVESLLKFIELVHVGEIFKEGLNDFELLKETIDIEDSAKFRGIGHIKNILLAIKKKKQLLFTHENYWRETETDYNITPLLLKEYLNRWYVVGVPYGKNEIRTFGIDRMTNINMGKTSSVKRKDYETQLDNFVNIIGLNYTAHNKVEHIKLKIYYKQIKYLESLPLHHSQKIEIAENDDFGIVSYHLIPNYEFEIQVLKMNSMVEVLEPVWFRDKIVGMIREMLGNYEL